MEVHYESAGKCLKINDKSGAGIENNAVVSTTQVGGGEGGIRTRGTVPRTHAFQACSLNHSDTSPITFFPDQLTSRQRSGPGCTQQKGTGGPVGSGIDLLLILVIAHLFRVLDFAVRALSCQESGPRSDR